MVSWRKKASAQAGFSIGFNESVFIGFDSGCVRGVTSALACLPDGLKERMVETCEKRTKFSQLYESVNSLSTTDALKLFHDDFSSKILKQSDSAGCISPRLNHMIKVQRAVFSINTTGSSSLFFPSLLLLKCILR